MLLPESAARARSPERWEMAVRKRVWTTKTVSIKSENRDKQKLEVGRDIPTPEEVRQILAAVQGRWRALLAGC